MKDNPIKRAITNLEWSPKHKELFLCSYHKSENDWDPSDTDGLVNIFSLQMPSAPELTLTCQSEITSCIFHPTEPYLVIGGTYSGNVIIWDMREKRNYPVVKSPTVASIMIKGIGVVGSQNANNIVTVSNEGSICVWSMNMMKEPQKKVDLMVKSTQELSVHCIDFPEGETNQFYVGSEDSNIYQAKIHTKNPNEQNIADEYHGHQASVLSLHHHPTIHERKSEASGLMLSTSADWNIGVWHPKTRKEPLLMHDGEVETYDAQWSPVHPSVFAACNGNGQVELWDIVKETEECRYRIDVDKRALSKIRWSQDGRKLLTGNSNGSIKLWNVDKEFYQYREEDLTKLERMLMPNKQNTFR
jgi:dynein intermediate chain